MGRFSTFVAVVDKECIPVLQLLDYEEGFSLVGDLIGAMQGNVKWGLFPDNPDDPESDDVDDAGNPIVGPCPETIKQIMNSYRNKTALRIILESLEKFHGTVDHISLEKGRQFWELDIERLDNITTVHSGKKGTKGKTITMKYPNYEAQFKERDKMLAQQKEAGYTLVPSSSSPLNQLRDNIDLWEGAIFQRQKDLAEDEQKVKEKRQGACPVIMPPSTNTDNIAPPSQVMLVVAEYLSAKDLIAASQVCQEWRQLFLKDRPDLFQSCYMRTWGSIVHPKKLKAITDSIQHGHSSWHEEVRRQVSWDAVLSRHRLAIIDEEEKACEVIRKVTGWDIASIPLILPNPGSPIVIIPVHEVQEAAYLIEQNEVNYHKFAAACASLQSPPKDEKEVEYIASDAQMLCQILTNASCRHDAVLYATFGNPCS